MAQYDKDKEIYVERKNNLFDVHMTSDENGELMRKRVSKGAFGVPKVIQDVSLFHGMFTYGILSRIWEELDFTVSDINNYTFNAVHLPAFSLAQSEDQVLKLSSGTTVNKGSGVRSKKHALYQPGRGVMLSTSVYCPDPEKYGVRNWGVSIPGSCIRFQLEGDGTNWELYAFRKNSGTVELREPLRQYLPDDFDIAYPHMFQIQFNSIGDILFFINQKLIYTEKDRDLEPQPRLPDTSLPCVYESITLEEGTELILRCHSVDISSEGAINDFKIPGAITTGPLVKSLSTGTAVLGMMIPRTISYNGVETYYSRGTVIDKITSWCRDESRVRVHLFRDTVAPNLDALTWGTIFDSHMMQLVGGDGSNLNTAFQLDKANSYLVTDEWADLEVKNEISIRDPDAQGLINPGDILIVEVIPITTNRDASAVIYYGELR